MNEDYRIDDLMLNGYRLMQNPKQFCFGTDSVLLADFAVNMTKKGQRIAELCCGNGAVSVLMMARRDDNRITGFELQKDVWELCEKNIELNSLEGKMDAVNTDLKLIGAEYYNMFDAVVVNPPYMAKDTGFDSRGDNKRISRQESEATFEDIVRISKKMLKTKGKLIFVHKASRTGELITTLSAYNFALKTLQCIHSKKDSPSSLVLMSASKGGGSWCDILNPIIIYNDNGSYTEELLKIYHMN